MFAKQLASLLLLGASALSVSAQQANLDAVLKVNVKDSSGRPLPGVTVTALEVATLTSRSAVTDREGRLEFSALPPGYYEVTAPGGALAGSMQAITLAAGRVFAITLSSRAKQEAMTREGTPKLVFEAQQDQGPPALTDLRTPSSSASASASPDASANLWASLESVEPFRIPGDAFRPALGELTGAQDRGGALHGDVYGFLGRSLMELNTMRVRDLALAEYGAMLGGSIDQGRTSYFTSFDRQSLDRNSLLSNPQGPALFTPEKPLTSSQLSGRLDHQFGQRDAANLRFHRSTLGGNSFDGGGSPARTGVNVIEQTATAQNTFAASPNTLNETRAQFTDSEVQLPAGAAALGIQSDVPTLRRNRVYEAADNLQRQLGRQAIRLGGDFFYNQMSVTFLEASLGNPAFSQSSQSVGAYAQNQWKMRPDLVISTGVRYDLQFVSNVHTNANNLAPQIGFAWSPGSSKNTVIRGDFGMFYEQFPLPAISGALDSGTNAPGTNAINLARAGRISYPRNNVPITALASFTTVDPFLQNAYAERAGLEFEQQIGAKSAVSVTYQHVRGVELSIPVARSSPLCAAAAGRCASTAENQGGRQYEPRASSSYDGVSVSFTQHPVSWGDYRVSYIYSSAQSSAGEDADAFAADQMRRVAFNASLHTSLSAGSNAWQRLSHGFTLSGYGDYTSRNDLPGLSLINLNAQLSKTIAFSDRFHLDAVADTFHTLERRNYSIANAISEMGSYEGDILASYERFAMASNPSMSRLGLRLTF